MSRYSIHNQENNLQLSYGWNYELGYHYNIVDLNESEDSEKFVIEE